jgi:hypothetical protein
MNYTEIRAEVIDTLARSDALVTDKVGTWINRRQRLAAARHNFAFMLKEATVAISANPASQQDYALPTDFKDERVIMLQRTTDWIELPVRGHLEMIRTFGRTDKGEPMFVTLEPGAGMFRLWPPIPDQNYTVLFSYYGWPADLSGTSTNWLTDNFPNLLIAGAVAEGWRFLGELQEAQWWDSGLPSTPGREQNPASFEAILAKAIGADKGRLLPADLALVPRLNALGDQLTPRHRDGWIWW